jgi:hypothetical protein
VLAVFVALTLMAGLISKLARSLAVEVDARAEADLSADLARILLHAPDVKTAQPAAARHLARALKLPSAAIRLGAIPDDKQHVAFPLHDHGVPVGSLLVPTGLPKGRRCGVCGTAWCPPSRYCCRRHGNASGSADEQVALRRLATLVAHGAPPGEVFGAVAREVGQILETRNTVVMRYEPDATVTTVGVWNTGPVVTMPPQLTLPAREGDCRGAGGTDGGTGGASTPTVPP